MNRRLKIKLKVINPNTFIRELIERKIRLYSITKKERELELIIDEENYDEISKIKTIKKLKITGYYGLSKLKYLIKKNKLIILLLIISVGLNIILSNIIFDIDVETPNKDLVKIIEKDLKKLGVKKYRPKISYSKREKIKEQLKELEKDKVEWLEIEEHGTKYIVKVEEKKLKEEEKECNPRNIVAKKNALITKIESSSGEIVKKINDYVETGEVLISGLIHKNEVIVTKRCAKGKVYGEAWYKVVVTVPKYYTEEVKTNNNSWGLSIKTPKKDININNKFQTFEEKEYNIIGSNLIGFGISISNYQELIKKEYKNTIKNVDKMAFKYAEEKIIKSSKSDMTVLRKKVLKKTELNSKIKVEVFLAIEEDITEYQDITDVDIEKLNELNKKEE